MTETQAEWFRTPSTWVWAGIAAAVGALFIAADVVDGWHIEVTAAVLFGLVLVYVGLVRPAVGYDDETLWVRTPISTEQVPLAAVHSVGVGRLLEIKAGDALLRTPAVASSRRSRHDSGPPRIDYGDLVATKIRDSASEARERLGIARESEEHWALGQKTRVWAWPEIAVVVASGLFFVLTLVL